jgi:hypothetical protein
MLSSLNASGVTYFKWIKRLVLRASSPSSSSTLPLISTPLRLRPSRDKSTITDAHGLAWRFWCLCVWREVGMQMSSPTRRNHMGRRWMLPSSSSVARFAMSVIERSFSISAGLRMRGLFEAMSGKRLVTSSHQEECLQLKAFHLNNPHNSVLEKSMLWA